MIKVLLQAAASPLERVTAVLEFLYALVPNQPRLHCRVRWAPGTVVFWDNRCLQHHAIWDYYPATRCGDRVTIQGTALAG